MNEKKIKELENNFDSLKYRKERDKIELLELKNKVAEEYAKAYIDIIESVINWSIGSGITFNEVNTFNISNRTISDYSMKINVILTKEGIQIKIPFAESIHQKGSFKMTNRDIIKLDGFYDENLVNKILNPTNIKVKTLKNEYIIITYIRKKKLQTKIKERLESVSRRRLLKKH